jgi:hypothetical protein
VDTCQYCGRPFCRLHSYRLEGHEAVCAGPRCRLKNDELLEHMAYRQAVARRNSAGLCGIDGCGPHPGLQCSLCLGHFCREHVRERIYPFREGRVSVDRPASVCERCWQRRKIWRR